MQNKQKCFIQAIILIIVALVIIKYAFGMNLNDIFNTQIAKDIFGIIKQLFLLLWQAISIALDYVKSAIPQIQQFLNSVPKPTN